MSSTSRLGGFRSTYKLYYSSALKGLFSSRIWLYTLPMGKIIKDAVGGGPLVSVIVPARDPGRFLKLTLASVYKQRDAAIEIIVVDDGSKENIPALLDSLLRNPSWEYFEAILSRGEARGVSRPGGPVSDEQRSRRPKAAKRNQRVFQRTVRPESSRAPCLCMASKPLGLSAARNTGEVQPGGNSWFFWTPTIFCFPVK